MPRRSTITDAQKERIYEMREAGAKYVEIEAATGVSISGATWLCVKEGVEHPTKKPRFLPPGRPAYARGKHTVRPYTAEEDALMERMRKEGASYGAIGRALTPPRCHSSVLGRLTTLARHAAVEEADG
jgi:hypothetical protein